MGSHFLLQGIFLTQELNPGLLHCRQILYCGITFIFYTCNSYFCFVTYERLDFYLYSAILLNFFFDVYIHTVLAIAYNDSSFYFFHVVMSQIFGSYFHSMASVYKGLLCGSDGKNLPTMQETWVQSLGWEDPLENRTTSHSSILA